MGITLFFVKHLHEDGQWRPKHVAGLSYICEITVFLFLYFCWNKCSEPVRFVSLNRGAIYISYEKAWNILWTRYVAILDTFHCGQYCHISSYSVPSTVKVTVKYVVTEGVVFQEFCQLCLKKGGYPWNEQPLFTKKQIGFVEMLFVNQLLYYMFCLYQSNFKRKHNTQ